VQRCSSSSGQSKITGAGSLAGNDVHSLTSNKGREKGGSLGALDEEKIQVR
jgi:hypothetical protein